MVSPNSYGGECRILVQPVSLFKQLTAILLIKPDFYSQFSAVLATGTILGQALG